MGERGRREGRGGLERVQGNSRSLLPNMLSSTGAGRVTAAAAAVGDWGGEGTHPHPVHTHTHTQQRSWHPSLKTKITAGVVLPLPPAHRQTGLCVVMRYKKHIHTVSSRYWALKQDEHVPPLSFSSRGVMVSGTSDCSMSFSLAMMCFTKQLAASSMLMFS